MYFNNWKAEKIEVSMLGESTLLCTIILYKIIRELHNFARNNIIINLRKIWIFDLGPW